MQAKILIIEDEQEMVELISLYLTREGFEVTPCNTAEQGLASFTKQLFDIILLDINLPGMDGFEFLQTIRKTSPVPVIIVSAREADEDLVMGLGIGADEFVIKPFSPKVLVARVRAILRRVRNLSAPKELLQFGPYTLDREGYVLKKGEKKIDLSTREFEVLRLLADNAGKTLTPEVIYKNIWQQQYGDITVIAVYIQRIRKKIESQPENPVFIETIYGKGYKFNRS